MWLDQMQPTYIWCLDLVYSNTCNGSIVYLALQIFIFYNNKSYSINCNNHHSLWQKKKNWNEIKLELPILK